MMQSVNRCSNEYVAETVQGALLLDSLGETARHFSLGLLGEKIVKQVDLLQGTLDLLTVVAARHE
jgi:hypothetical protein